MTVEEAIKHVEYIPRSELGMLVFYISPDVDQDDIDEGLLKEFADSLKKAAPECRAFLVSGGRLESLTDEQLAAAGLQRIADIPHHVVEENKP